MKKFLFGFLLGIVAGVAALWQLQQTIGIPTGSRTNTLTSSFRDTFAEVTPEAIQEELTATSIVVREKAKQAGQMLKDATANARLTTAIKFKLLAEPNLPGMQINVDSAGGLVTLSGTVPSHDHIARAVRLALETEGVRKVVSTIQVQEPPKEAAP